MSFLTENWFFLLVALGCIGMHLFGHGHGHGHGQGLGQGHGQGHEHGRGHGGRDHDDSSRDDGAFDRRPEP